MPKKSPLAKFLSGHITSEKALQCLWWWSLAGALTFARALWVRYWPAGGGLDVLGYHIGHDFVNVWTGAKLAIEGKVAAIFSIDGYMAEMDRLMGAKSKLHNFSYPPHLLVLILVFGCLPYFQSLALWTVSGFAAFTSALRANKFKKPDDKTVLLLALCPLAIINIVLGQNGFFTAALFLGGLYLSEKKPVPAGILIGLLTVKPHLGILLPFVLIIRRNWKCFWAAAVTTFVLAGSSIAIWGLQPWIDFVQVTIPFQQSLLANVQGFYVTMMPSIYSTALQMPHPGPLAKGFWAVLHVTAALWAIAITLVTVKRQGITARSVLLLAFATIITLPYCYNYDMGIIMGALVIYLGTVKRLPLPVYALLGLLWTLPLSIIEMRLAGMPLAPLIILASFAAVAKQRD